MSVILNALRATENEQDKDPSLEEFYVSTSRGVTEGLGSEIRRSKWFVGPVVLIMIGLLWWGSKKLQNRSQQPVAEKPKIAVKATPQAAIVSVDNLLDEGFSLFRQGKLDQSLAHFQAALKKQPNEPQIHNSIGVVFLQKGLYSNALQSLNQALSLDPKCVPCLNNLGHLKSRLGEWVEAQAYYKKAIRIDPNYPDAYFNLGVLLEESGDLQSAAEYYKRFVATKKNGDPEILQKVKERIRMLSE